VKALARKCGKRCGSSAGPGSRRVRNHRACSSTNIFYVTSFGYIQQVVLFYESFGSNLGRTSCNLQATSRTLKHTKVAYRRTPPPALALWALLASLYGVNLNETNSILMQGTIILHVFPWKLGVGRLRTLVPRKCCTRKCCNFSSTYRYP
jgi:hypothetical protein